MGPGTRQRWGIKTRHIASACIVLWRVVVSEAPVLTVGNHMCLRLCQHKTRIKYVSTMPSEVETEYCFIVCKSQADCSWRCRASATSSGTTNLLVELNNPFRERLVQKVPDLMPPKEKRCLAILFRQSLDVAGHAWWNGHQKVIICIEDFAATPSHPIGNKPA